MSSATSALFCRSAVNVRLRSMAKPPMGGNRSREPLASGPEALQFPQELQPDIPREPILTLPGALTAYVLLLAVIHVRVLLPSELENWTVDALGFIPTRS